MAHIRSLLLEHHVLLFPDQSLRPGCLLRLARRFGTPSQYPFVRGLDGFPEIVEVLKRENDTQNFGGVWHTDTIYTDTPPFATMLYALQVPPTGGDTIFANQVSAFEQLSESLKHLLRKLHALHTSEKADAAATRRQRQSERPGSASTERLSSHHPVVRTHPETGLESLYLSPGHTERLIELHPRESSALLDVLFSEQTRPELTCRIRWRVGSLAFWDTRSSLHLAVNDYDGHRRQMHRVTLVGERPR